MRHGFDDDAEYWHSVVAAAGLGVWDYDTLTGEKTYSPRWREIRHLRPDDPLPTTDEAWLDIVHPEDRAIAQHYTDLINKGLADDVAFEYRERGASGQWIWIMCRGRALRRDETGLATRFVGIDTDITAIKAAEQARAVYAKQLEIAVDMAGIGIWKFEIETGDVTWDSRLRKIYGVADDGAPLPKDIWERSIHPDDLARVLATTELGVERKEDYTLDYRIIRAGGEVRHLRSRASFMTDGLAGLTLIGVDWDMTDDLMRAIRLEEINQIAEQRLAKLTLVQTELEMLSRHDPLTGLPNRRSLDEYLLRLVPEDAAISGVAFMLIDIDQFKAVNDTYGHAFGDRMLQAIAGALEREISPAGLLTRSGGDEFLAVFSEYTSVEGLQSIATAAIRRTRDVSRDLGHEVTISIGIEARRDRPATRDELFAFADKAMYRAKQSGGAQALVF